MPTGWACSPLLRKSTGLAAVATRNDRSFLSQNEYRSLRVHSAAKPNRRCGLAAIPRAIDDVRLKRVLAAAIMIEPPDAPAVKRRSSPENNLWRAAFARQCSPLNSVV